MNNDTRNAHHLSMHWERAIFVTFCSSCLTCTSWLKSESRHLSSMFMCVSPWVRLSPLLLRLVLPCLLLLLPPLALRAAHWARQPDRHAKPCASPRIRGVTTPMTSTPPSQVMSPTSWLSASSTTLQVPSPTLSRHRTRTWMTWHSASCSQRHTEDKPITANQKARQSVSRRRLLCSMVQGNLRRKKCRSISWFWCHKKHVQCSQQVFWQHPSWEKWSIDQRNLRSEIAQMHRLGLCLKNRDRWLSQNIARKLVITNSKQLTQKKNAEFYEKDSDDSKWNFAKFTNKVLQRWRNYTNSKVLLLIRSQDESSSRTRTLFLELSGRVQELQNEVNCMNDSQDFQDAESVHSGNSHITSRPMSSPPHPLPEGRLRLSFVSPCRKEGPPSIWDTHGISGNVFANPHASSSALYPQELNPWVSTFEEPLLLSTAERSERPEQNQDLRCQSGPSAKNSVIFSGEDSSKNYGADQQRLQISDLHFDKFPTPATFACWKIRFKTEVCTCSQFSTEVMQWIKEVELVDSVDELRSSSSTRGISVPNFEVLDARIASALNKIIHISHFKRRISLEEQKAQKQDSFFRGRQITYLIYDHFRVIGSHDSVEKYTDLFTIVLRNDDIIQSGTEFLLSRTKIPHDDILEGLYKLRIRESEKLKTALELCDLDSSEEVRTWLSQIENNSEKKYRARNLK